MAQASAKPARQRGTRVGQQTAVPPPDPERLAREEQTLADQFAQQVALSKSRRSRTTGGENAGAKAPPPPLAFPGADPSFDDITDELDLDAVDAALPPVRVRVRGAWHPVPPISVKAIRLMDWHIDEADRIDREIKGAKDADGNTLVEPTRDQATAYDRIGRAREHDEAYARLMVPTLDPTIISEMDQATFGLLMMWIARQRQKMAHAHRQAAILALDPKRRATP